MCASERKEEGESACVRTSRGCVVFELLLVLSGFVPAVAIKSSAHWERARGRDNWERSPGYSAAGLVELTGGKDERKQRLGAKFQMVSSNEVGRAAGMFTHCELTFEVDF